jgi:phospholipid/cholesterol/gamma-HCH transport system substrate-binding protein
VLTRAIRLKLTVFVLVGALAVGYGLFDLLGVQRLFDHPTEVRAVFADPQGIYPLADVDLLGVHVGSVQQVRPGPHAASTVVMELDHGARVPADVAAQVSSKSAIGEQYVELVPRSPGGRLLQDGDTIPLARTTSPPDLGSLIGHVDDLVKSVPIRSLRTTLSEGSLALQGFPATFGRVLQDSDQLSASAERNADDLIALIRSARTVLDTQVALGGRTKAYAASLAELSTQLRALDPTFDRVFVRGVATGQQVSGLLRDNQAALPVMLNNLVSLTTLGDRHLAGIRKSLVVFPWVLEYNAQALRYCDRVHVRTGTPVRGTCHYDAQGRPIWSAHVADVYKVQGSAPDNPCIRGYETTKRYLPDGRPADGRGPRESSATPPNFAAHCAAPPTDPQTPNVRGFQNLRAGGAAADRPAPAWGMALMDPESGVVVAPDGVPLQLTDHLRPPPHDGSADLGWLMTHVMTDAATSTGGGR